MLLTITSTNDPATDLGYLLYKNPANIQSFDLTFGKAHVFYSEATSQRCTACLLLDIDPVRLVRGSGKEGAEGQFDQYVNDRPYVASSFMSVAIAEVFGSALSGKSRERPELVNTKLPLEATIAALPCKGSEETLRNLFEPLGYTMTIQRHPLDPNFPEWGESPYYTITLSATCTLHDLLSHIYVLIPVLDNAKHYLIGEEEVAKLLRHGEGWLAAHPEKEFIAKRYLKHRDRLTKMAIERLVIEEDSDPDATDERYTSEEDKVESKISLNEHRMAAVLESLKKAGARRVIDLGCGEGRLVARLLNDWDFSEVVGLDVSSRALEIAGERLHIERLPEKKRDRLKLIQGSLTYKDKRMTGFDAATCIEVIEHLDPPRLTAFERVVFEFAKPRTVIVTTPNVEYNAKFETLPAGKFRHRDHRFEWTRTEFEQWAQQICIRHGYKVEFAPVGDEDPELGAPTQMARFHR